MCILEGLNIAFNVYRLEYSDYVQDSFLFYFLDFFFTPSRIRLSVSVLRCDDESRKEIMGGIWQERMLLGAGEGPNRDLGEYFSL